MRTKPEPLVEALVHARSLTSLIITAWIVLGSPMTSAQDAAPIDNLDRLDNALLDLTRESSPSRESDSEIETLRAEIADIRNLLHTLQETLDGKLAAITELEDENQRLRQALRVRYGREEAGLPPVPMPNRELIESVLRESAARSSNEAVAPQTPEAEPYTIVSEWGRSPEVVADLPGNVSSLKGMAIAVVSGTREDALRALGRELRQTYGEYDNINIEIFDDLEAARNYADQGTTSEKHRVLSISKHRHSGRDTIALFRNGVPVIIR